MIIFASQGAKQNPAYGEQDKEDRKIRSFLFGMLSGGSNGLCEPWVLKIVLIFDRVTTIISESLS